MTVPTWRTRPAPPQPRRPLLHRPRLAALMAERWQRRLVAIVAGAGFGKSGLIADALSTNRREPLGHDAWVGCQEDDGRLDRLFSAVYAAVRGDVPVDLPADLDDAVRRIGDVVWSHAPLPVTILLDDVHLLPLGSGGERLLAALVRRLPSNAHFVLASRTMPDVGVSRLLANGEALVISERGLVMTDDELRTFAADRGRPDLDLSATGGWPALAELALHTGTVRAPEVTGYLVDEVLAGLADPEIEALALLRTVGPLATSQLDSALGSTGLDLAALGRLPLVHTAGEVLEAHSLWDVAIEAVDPERRRTLLAAGSAALASDGPTERAFTTALLAGDEPRAIELLGGLCSEAIHTAVDIDLGACVAALPAHRQGAPEAVLARALTTGAEWSVSRDRLVAASIELAAAGTPHLEVISLIRLGVLGWQAGDLSVADHLLPRIERLAASGDPLAAAVTTLGTTLLAELDGDHATMWAGLESLGAVDVPEPLRAMVERYRASIDLLYGDAGVALRRAIAVEPAAPSWLRVELRVLAMWACWSAGDITGATRWGDQLESSGGDEAPRVVARANRSLLDAWTGRHRTGSDAAGAIALSSGSRELGLLVPAVVASLAAATHAVEAGDEQRAADVVRQALASTNLSRALPAIARALGLVWVLLPELHDEVGGLPLGAGPTAARRAAQALLDARRPPADGGAWQESATEVLAHPGVATQLPPVWVAELAARHVGAAPTEPATAVARSAVDRLGPLAPHALRHLAAISDDPELVRGATSLLSLRTPVSEGRFVLRLLGPVTIEQDGTRLDRPDWSRERVRGLFALIARHGTIGRRSAAERLWPDLDDDAAANNLRVSLSYLQRVLEPERTRHETAYHVRGDGAVLAFAGRPSWTVDVEEFDRRLDDAERDDQRGESTVALLGYQAALAWYRGPFLEDVTVDVADELERDRLRSRYVRAALRAGALLLAVDRVAEAQRLAVAAQAADPWSEQALHLQTACYLAVGDRAAARRTQHRAEELAEELGIPTSSELERLARAVEI